MKVQSLLSNRILKNYLWVFLGQNFGTLFSMLSLIITLRIISTVEYGSLVIVQTYCLLISGIFGIRSFNGLIKFSTDAEEQGNFDLAKQYINSAFLFDLIVGVLGLIVAYFISSPVSKLMGWQSDDMHYLMLYLPVIIFLPILNGAPVGILRKLGYFKHINIIHTLIYGIQTALLFLTWFLNLGNLELVYLQYMLIEVTEAIILVFFALKVLLSNPKYNDFWTKGFCLSKEYVSFNLYFGLISSVDQVLGNLSTMIINKYLGNYTTACLKVITRICSLLTKITNPIGQVIYPEICQWMSRGEYSRVFRLNRMYIALVTILGVIILGLVYVTYDYWIYIFDESMSSAKWQSILYLLFSIMSISIICIHQISFALNIMKQNLIITTVANVAYLLALVPAINLMGVYGFLILQIVQLVVVAFAKYSVVLYKIKKIK